MGVSRLLPGHGETRGIGKKQETGDLALFIAGSVTFTFLGRDFTEV